MCEALENGISVDHIAKCVEGLPGPRSLNGRRSTAHGAEALRTKKTRGPKSNLDDGQMSFGLAFWARGMIQELILQRFGIRLSLMSVSNVLDKLGISPQWPLFRAYEQDPERWENGRGRPSRISRREPRGRKR